jgi:hypothetical protein
MPNGWRLAENRVNEARRRTQKHAPRKHILKGKNPIDACLQRPDGARSYVPVSSPN